MKHPKITVTVTADWLTTSEAVNAILLRVSEVMEDMTIVDRPGYEMEARVTSPGGDLLAPVKSVTFHPEIVITT